MRIAILASLLVAAGLPCRARAQLRADPGIVINGRVAVRVYVTLSDDETAYAPIAGVSLRFFRTTADTTVSVRTDDAGTATALLSPGEYRLMSTTPVDWKGGRYSWSRLVQVRAGIPTIELNAVSAERVASPPDVIALDSTSRRLASRDADTDVSLRPRDPGLATMISFFAPGGGHIYAGERGKGAGLLALFVAGAAVTVDQLSCASSSRCESTTSGMALGAAGMLAAVGSWIYAVYDADDAARRANLAHGMVSSGVAPLITPGVGAGLRVGFSVALAR